MLVLSRRLGQKILLPTINASISITSIKSGVVRIGFEGPSNVPVFRAEIFNPQRWEAEQRRTPSPGEQFARLQHALRNRLNAPVIALALLRRQLDLGLFDDARATLDRIEEEMGNLKERIDSLEKVVPPVGRIPRRALLVEDDKNECELLAGFLRLAGMEVDTAGDGADALDYLRKGPRPDVVLLDMILPDFDGPTIVKEVRRDPALGGLKIFGVTGHAPERFDLERGPQGVDGWFSKPINPEQLLRTLQELPRDS